MGAFVFVYGTLMRGAANHGVLERLGARFVRAATTAEPRTVVDLGPYPALLAAAPDRDAMPIAGELYEIRDDALADLDDFEGCPELYRRERILLDGGVEAFAYVFARKHGPA